MSYQITKVANGFMVTSAANIGYSFNNVATYSNVAIHVFATWQEVSAWLDEQFKKGTER